MNFMFRLSVAMVLLLPVHLLISFDPGRTNSSLRKSEALKEKVFDIVNKDLNDCFLSIIYQHFFDRFSVLQDLLILPNIKEVTLLSATEDLNEISWKNNRCTMVIFLLDDVQPVIPFCNDRQTKWNHLYRFIVVTKSIENVSEIANSMIGKKTEHILGIVPLQKSDKWLLHTNVMFPSPSMQLLSATSKNVSFFPDKLNNFKKATIKFTTFEWAPNVFYHRNEKNEVVEMYGMDPLIVKTLSEKLNFTLELMEPPLNEFWGAELADGNWTGLVGLVSNDIADIGVCDVFLTYQRKDVVDFSSPYWFDPSCFMGPHPAPVPRSTSLLRPFTYGTWLSLLAILVVCGSYLYFLSSNKIRTSFNDVIPKVSCWIVPFQVFTRTPTSLILQQPSSRIFIAFFWIYGTIMTIGYSSNLTSFLTISQKPYAVETIEELRYSEFEIASLGPFFKTTLLSSKDQNLNELAERFLAYDSLTDVFEEIMAGRAVMLQNILFLEYAIDSRLYKNQPDPRKNFRILKECFSPFHVGMYLQKKSLIKKKIDLIIGRIMQSGLVIKWHQDSLRKSRKMNRDRFVEETTTEKPKSENDGFVKLTLDHLAGIFYILIMGLVLAFLEFLLEVISAKPKQ